MSKKTALDTQVGGDHYKGLAIQPAVYCELNGLSGLESSVVKYTTRNQFKNKAEDIKKAIHCLQLILEITYGDDK